MVANADRGAGQFFLTPP